MRVPDESDYHHAKWTSRRPTSPLPRRTKSTAALTQALDQMQGAGHEQVTLNSGSAYAGTWTASYDPNGNLASETDPNGVTTNWTRDETGQQIQETANTANGPCLPIPLSHPSTANGSHTTG